MSSTCQEILMGIIFPNSRSVVLKCVSLAPICRHHAQNVPRNFCSCGKLTKDRGSVIYIWGTELNRILIKQNYT